ncbi:MAG: transcriptional repressor NrdR [Armatimonadetes bacterium]|nr:transcriptional repressor NrdR [Armatimonadota bacterium]
MRCPFCGVVDNRVLDSRTTEDGHSIRRRRECDGCKRRFTTYERFEESLLMVVKKDGRREKFDRRKMLDGILSACQKRPVSYEAIERVVTSIEQHFRNRGNTEIGVEEIGGQVMEHLRSLDEIAYVRFASVYKEFKDVSRFVEELKVLDQLRRTLSEKGEEKE